MSLAELGRMEHSSLIVGRRDGKDLKEIKQVESELMEP